MSDSLRILHYNLQLRSWGMEAGADESIPPSTTAEERAGLAVTNILSSRHDYDVLCLNEVFDEDARPILLAGLLPTFPFAIAKADFGALHVAWPGKPIVPVNPAALALTVTGVLPIAGWIGLGKPKAEDSGVMVFSRWPFATRPLTDTMVGLLDPLAHSELTPIGLPEVGFSVYEESDGNDAWAAKGVVYARVERSPSRVYNIFASHTQADEEFAGQYRTPRVAQMAQVWGFITQCLEGGPSPGEEVFFLGDLNVIGDQANGSGLPVFEEWSEWANTPGAPFTDQLIDLWGCRGGGELRDPGFTAPSTFEPFDQRLDYAFASATGALALQHIYVDYELATVPPGVPGVSFLSDHRPLGVDLNIARSFCTPTTALVASADPSFQHSSWLPPGGVAWYRFDVDGTYDMRVTDPGRARFKVYLDTDLSRPRQQYRREEHPDLGPRFVIPSAPFLVKVSGVDRSSEVEYEFGAVRHEGRAPWDAIDLIPEITRREAFPAWQWFNTDLSATPWDDTDTKWFRLDPPMSHMVDGVELSVDVVLTGHADGGAVLRICQQRTSGSIDFVTEDGPSTTGLRADWIGRPGELFYVCVQRLQVGGPPLAFEVIAHSNVSMILGGTPGEPRLVCIEETSGWGSDDISVRISADGDPITVIPNHEIGDMDGGDARDLEQWIPQPIVYTDGVEFTVVEEDDLDPDDIGTVIIPPMDQIGAAQSIRLDRILPDGSARITGRAAVDDGVYEVRLTIARWNEQA